MSTVDHGHARRGHTISLGTGEASRQYLFRLCGGRVGGAAGPPVPTAEIFERNSATPRSDFVVGVIDTGLALPGGTPHPWLSGHVEYDDDEQDPIPESPGILADEDGHGSFVTGLILRQAPAATVRMIRAIDNAGNVALTDATVAAAIDTLASDPRVKVINLSFSGQSGEPTPPRGIQRALSRLGDRDVVVVAAAGNNATTDLVWPGAFDGVIAVGAVDETLASARGALPPLALFSNHGEWVDAYASGVNVLGPFLDFQETTPRQTFTGWARWGGTSFAAAIVAGRIARRAIDDDISSSEAAHRVINDGPQLMSSDFATSRHPTYVPSVDSTWSAVIS